MMQNKILKTGKFYIMSSVVASLLLSGCFGGEEKKQASAESVVKPVEQPKVEQPASTAVTENVVKDVVEKVEVAKEEVKDVVATVEKEVQQTPVATPAIDGAKLYAKCASCHGANGEKVALNVSKVIKDLSKDDFIAAIKGYQNGTYGGSMKTLMTGQVKSLSEEEIKAIANFIVK